jgi:hypothetical protein
MKRLLYELLAGILTKPDLIDQGAPSALDRWVRTIEGNEDQLQLGYYCVRLPNELERLRNQPDEAQRAADEYFNDRSPWREIRDRTRLGIPAFVHNISKILVNHIMET